MDEPLLFTLTSPSLHFRQTGSFLQFILTKLIPQLRWTSPTIYIGEPSTAYQTDGLLPTIHIDEALPSTQMDELLLFTLTSPSLHFRQTGSCLQFTRTSSSQQLYLTSSSQQLYLMSSSQQLYLTNSNYTVWEPSRFKQNIIQNFNDAV